MKQVSVSSHRDGHSLVINEVPWFRVLVERIFDAYLPRWGWDYRLWNRILIWTSRRDRELLRLPIEHSCDIAAKLWPQANISCWHGAAITDEINSDPDEVALLRAARENARQGFTVPLRDLDKS